MWFASLLPSQKSGCQRTHRGSGHSTKLSAFRPRLRHHRPEAERLEDRTLLTVQFTPGPYLTPTNCPDVPLGVIGASGVREPSEPILSVNSAEPGNIALSSQNGLRITTNAGATFGPVVHFAAPPGSTFQGDADLTFDAQGRLFWSNLTNGDLSVNQINPTTGAAITSKQVSSGPNDDRPFMTIDTNPGSPFFNNIYAVWAQFSSGLGFLGRGRVLFSRSTDQAVTWSTPLELQSSTSVEGFVVQTHVAVAPNGDVYVAYHSYPALASFFDNPDGNTGQTFVLRSTDGGVSFAQKTLAFGPGQSDVTFNIQSQPRTIPGTQFWTVGCALERVLADPVRPGNVYVVTADDPTNGAGAPYSRIVFARSTDNGTTWSFPQAGGILAPLDGDAFQLLPTAAIDPFGNIVVAWYDNRRGLTNSRGRFLLDVFATYSTDGGLTWATPFQVTDSANPFDPDVGAGTIRNGPPPTTWIGGNFGIALFGGTAYLTWNGNSFRTGIPVNQQVWFSSFAISGALTVTGTPGDDTITVRSMADNPDFMEVLVNGRREYAGLWSALTGITIAATPGNDTINIEDIPAGLPLTVNLGDGSDTVNLSPTAHNLSTLAGTVTINGGSGADTLNLLDQANSDNANYTLTSSTVARPGLATVTYLNLAQVALAIGSATDTITVQSTPAGTAVALKGGGNATLVGSVVENRWDVIGSDAGTLSSASIAGLVTFSSVQNLIGGPGNNTFVFRDGAGLSGNLDGGGGTNTLDYSAYGGNVIVNLQLGTATVVGGSIVNIQNVTGGGGYNILVGNGGNVLRGGNGRNLLIAGPAASTLLGSTDESILIGGSTSYDRMPDQLVAIMDYWTGTEDYATRVFNLTHGIGVPLLDAMTVTGNGGGNTLAGGAGLALFYGNLALDSYDWDPLTEAFIAV